VDRSARLVGVGVFVIGGLLLFGLALFLIGSRQGAFADRFTIYTQFDRITGLQPGAPIQVSGARAGAVKAIAMPAGPGQKFRVTLDVDEKLHALVRADSVASIETEGLVGGSYLNIARGSPGAPEAASGTVIPSREPFEVADLMREMSATVKMVNTTIAAVQGDLEQTMASIAATVENANDLIEGINGDVTQMAKAGARISGDVADIADRINRGEGTIGRLVNDDALYDRAVGIANHAEQIAAQTQDVVAQANQALANLQGPNGQVAGLATTLERTLDNSRDAMAELADALAALKHNFLLRGFFKDRGYFSLADLTAADYLKGQLTRGGDRRKVRVWLGADILFERAPGDGAERLTAAGKARLDSAIAPYLADLAGSPLVIEGYAQQGSQAERYLRSRTRASLVREYLIERFDLEPRQVGAMPLGDRSSGSPRGAKWKGVALAVFLNRSETAPPS
jgi:phospholipid/cholesterol/gamma-HCH transport system substrate-binding protein